MTKIGVIGLGMMGGTHLDAYQGLSRANVIAVADIDPERRSGKSVAAGNIDGQAQGGFDFSKVKQYASADELIADPEVELVDICLPTPQHAEYAIQALESGKHVLVEKPLARTEDQAKAIQSAAEQSEGMLMCAMCMRFWPGWTWLKEAVDSQRYGRVLSASFRRLTSHPGGDFYLDGEQCGGAVLDLHIHDADFVQYLFGMPKAVFAQGYCRHTDHPDHVTASYLYGDNGPMVTAEGGWAMQKPFGFKMQYCVNFETATAIFDLDADPVLSLAMQSGETESVKLPAGMGYEHELEYFLECIETNTQPRVVTIGSAAQSLRLIEAEEESIRIGGLVELAAVRC